ncbi:hypothetical protein GCM10010256_78120 [Streptomyces coeruleorubidus]|nr:hypothetical protein GCM10010256_78120 [Streptomyces coeruleorubidus]
MDMDERAEAPGEETEPEESEEAVRTALWVAWTAGGPAEGATTRPARRRAKGKRRATPRTKTEA